MKRSIIVLLTLALLSLAPAAAQTGLTYVPLGYQQITSLSSAASLTVPTGATLALISVEGAAIRYRDDGTAPTSTVGMPIAVGQSFQYSSSLSRMQIIQQSGSATVNILYYR